MGEPKVNEDIQMSEEEGEIAEKIRAAQDKQITEESVDVVDLRTVLSMFQGTKERIEKIEAQIKQESQKSITISKDQELQKSFDHYDKRMEEIMEQCKASNRKMNLMADILVYNQQVMDDLARRLDSVEISNAKRSAILTGLAFSKKKKYLIQQVKDLFLEVLDVDTEIEDAYTLGEKTAAPVVITFPTSIQKSEVFKQKGKLSTITGEKGVRIYLNDYLPSAINEKRAREREVIKQAKAENNGKEVDVEYTKSGIRVQGNLYKKAIIPPKPTDLLDLKVDDLNKILKTPTSKGPPINKNGNTFIGYGVDVSTFQQIRDVYLKLRLVHPKARHIVCAYNLPQHGPQYQDYCDGQEYGTGRVLLKELKNSNVLNKAVFAIRYCGEKLGNERHSQYLESVKRMLEANPYNTIRNEEQKILSKENGAGDKHFSSTIKTQSSEKNDQQAPSATAFANLFKSMRGGLSRGGGRGRGRGYSKNRKEATEYSPKSEDHYRNDKRVDRNDALD